MQEQHTVLIVDDEVNALKVLSAILHDAGYRVLESLSVDKAIALLSREKIDAIITDLRMPVRDGYYFFDYVADHRPDIPVMFLTAYGTVESAVEAMSNGAYYYFIKPPDFTKLKSTLAQAVEESRRKRDLNAAGASAATPQPFVRIVGQTPVMRSLCSTINSLKDSRSSVLIQGETGTGKEVIARNLHFRSSRSDKPFVAVNCAAIPRELLESELFGYEKGAFTGAAATRIGRFEEAGCGSLFLDEIGELELTLQSKLLRVLQEREIERLGSNRKIKVDFRLLSSTNRDLRAEVQSGRFREDLFYRINVVQIDVPPLRDRPDDIPLLVTEFLNDYCLRENKSVVLADGVMDILVAYSWPGNIRQLSNVIERAVVLTEGKSISVAHLPPDIRSRRKEQPGETIRPLREMELEAVSQALQECCGNKSEAAKKLGISRKTFYKRLKQAGIETA